jgi:hypothetical protein
MGFRVGRVFVLDFGREGETGLAGATVKMRSCSVEALEEFTTTDDEVRGAEILAAHLIEWDLEHHDGTPIPATAAGLRSLDPPAARLIVIEWLRAVRGISAPFDRRSASGGPPPQEAPAEPFIQMEPL